ncbi:MAG: class I SAM-dependent methyltransferase [Nitrospira sp.]|nr:class I SAM-dependent methyltransferase [Nitrospira sp.]
MDHAGCRFCGTALQHIFVDLGMSPMANSYLKPHQLNRMEPFYPLRAFVCEQCFLVQLEEFESPDHIFSDYAYFSSFSDLFLQHAKEYVDMAMDRFKLGAASYVVEIASNDGYLLQNFVKRGVPVLGIEPAKNVAEVAVKKGVPSLVKFFGVETARELAAKGRRPDLLIGNNVLAHVPDLNDFVGGLKILLSPSGVVTMEFPHLMRLMGFNQFDTIYHEHFSYFSLTTVTQIFSKHGLTLFDVEEISTHGGSLRIYARHDGDGSKPVTERLTALRAKEATEGFATLDHYLSFSEGVNETKRALLEFLIKAKREGKKVVAYGAAAKASTLLNFCGVRTDLVDYLVDRSTYKQGHWLPGVHIPIYDPERIKADKPDYVMILAWNLKDEVMAQMAFIRDWGGKFVVPIPKITVHS